MGVIKNVQHPIISADFFLHFSLLAAVGQSKRNWLSRQRKTLLTHPQVDAQQAIMTDASDVDVGAVLQQKFGGQCHPISCFSKKLKPAETWYSVFDRKLLAIYRSIRHFRHMVEGREFCVNTDHKPLTRVSHSAQHLPRLTRYLDFISQFTGDIRHVNGIDNPVADAVSRIEINQLSPGANVRKSTGTQRFRTFFLLHLVFKRFSACSRLFQPIWTRFDHFTLFLRINTFCCACARFSAFSNVFLTAPRFFGALEHSSASSMVFLHLFLLLYIFYAY
jgi:hypothetical protein